MSAKPLPAPPITPESKPFWDATQEGKLLIGACRQCQRLHFYPRAICPHCFSTDVHWPPASGRGVIYSFSVMLKAKEPYAIAYVQLDEGVRMLTNIVDCDLNSLRCGQAVTVKFVASASGTAVPVFTPV